LSYFDYDPSLRFALPVEYDVEPGTLEITLQDDGPLRLRRFGRVRIKQADLGSENGRMVIDFNYAYNPSCAYNPRWHCPLAPAENDLPVQIVAGEQRYGG
jgi:uncharacterized protein (DUF1684 family)